MKFIRCIGCGPIRKPLLVALSNVNLFKIDMGDVCVYLRNRSDEANKAGVVVLDAEHMPDFDFGALSDRAAWMLRQIKAATVDVGGGK